MLSEEFEKALVFHEDLEETARRLMEQANTERNEQYRRIQVDLKTAKLIEYALMEPKNSAAFALGKAYLRTFQKKHKPHGDVISHLLLKELDDKQNTTERKERDNDKGKGKSATGTSEPKTAVIREGERSAKNICPGVSATEPGEGC